ncbi:hypothetical protein [Streptomyces fumanus]|uniref:hypothetical protein n=1 Tax=Streptomyces fumanus TaxID=67302 RepID=UPI00340618E4
MSGETRPGQAAHPGLFDRARRLTWRGITLDHPDRVRAHHHLEIRRLKTAASAQDEPGQTSIMQETLIFSRCLLRSNS